MSSLFTWPRAVIETGKFLDTSKTQPRGYCILKKIDLLWQTLGRTGDFGSEFQTGKWSDSNSQPKDHKHFAVKVLFPLVCSTNDFSSCYEVFGEPGVSQKGIASNGDLNRQIAKTRS
jgi:hypothetical protein